MSKLGSEDDQQNLNSEPSQRETIVAVSDAMKRVLKLVEKIAPTETTVLLTGESGTGKEKIARFLHLQSRRAGKPFVAVNAAAIAEGLVESELFGHVRGAFTDARDRRRGYFEQADQGTLFLDEIAETSPSVQVKLLRVLQDMDVRPVGAEFDVRVDVRVVAATNKDLKQALAAGQFRDDLYYRLNVFRIHLPPLRERKDDVPFLANYFLRIYSEKNRREVGGISDVAMAYLIAYPFPGNIRELQNAIERAVLVCEGAVITPGDLPPEVLDRGLPLLSDGAPQSLPDGLTLEQLEARYIRQVIQREAGNLTRAAKKLGISRSTLWRKMARYGISSPTG